MAWKRRCRCRRTAGDGWLSGKAGTSPSSRCLTARKARRAHRCIVMPSKRPNTENVMSSAAIIHTTIQGYVSKGFEAVRDAFLENFSCRNELGAACCVYRHGEKVVDLWGGIALRSPRIVRGARSGRLLRFRRSASWDRLCVCHQSYGHGTAVGSTRRGAEKGASYYYVQWHVIHAWGAAHVQG
jgi:hypothetical protein